MSTPEEASFLAILDQEPDQHERERLFQEMIRREWPLRYSRKRSAVDAGLLPPEVSFGKARKKGAKAVVKRKVALIDYGCARSAKILNPSYSESGEQKNTSGNRIIREEQQ